MTSKRWLIRYDRDMPLTNQFIDRTCVQLMKQEPATAGADLEALEENPVQPPEPNQDNSKPRNDPVPKPKLNGGATTRGNTLAASNAAADPIPEPIWGYGDERIQKTRAKARSTLQRTGVSCCFKCILQSDCLTEMRPDVDVQKCTGTTGNKKVISETRVFLEWAAMTGGDNKCLAYRAARTTSAPELFERKADARGLIGKSYVDAKTGVTMEIVTVAPPTGGGDLVAFIRQAGKITPGVQECREVDLAMAAGLIDPKHGSTNLNRKRAKPFTNVTPETAGTTKAKIMAEIETYCKDTCNGSIVALSSLLTVRGFSQPDIGTALKKAFPSTTTPSQTQDTRITATSSSQRHLDNPTPSALAQQNPYVDKLFLSYRDNKKWYITLTPNATTEEWSATIVTWPLPGKDHVGITYLGTEIVNGFWTATQLSKSLEPLCNTNGLKSEVRKSYIFNLAPKRLTTIS
jgi:hypothetical protein